MTSRHLFRLAVVAVCLGMCIIGQEPTVNWDSVMRAAKTYFSTPSSENALALYNALPKTQIRGEDKDFSEGSAYVKASNYIFDNLSLLEKQVTKPDRNAVKVAVRLWSIADGAFAEWLCDMLYGVVRVDPRMFLEEFSCLPGTYQEMVDVLGSVLHGGVRLFGGKTFKAEAALEELETRVKALESVESDDLLVIKLRGEAISLIKSDIQGIEAERGLIPMDALGVFLQSAEISERRAAYLDILKNRGLYIDQIKQGLETFERIKDRRFDILNRYIYRAAIIRSDKFINPLVMLINDYGYLGECIYCCPIIFALTLYAGFANWSPPAEITTNTVNTNIADLLNGIQYLFNTKSRPLVSEPTRTLSADPKEQKLLDEMYLLSEEELIKKAGPENANYSERCITSSVLSRKVVDDRNLTELYWLAIEEPRDASGIYRCNVYWAIERAEIARAQKNPLR